MTYPVWTPAYIGVGSNLNNPQAQVLRGIESLADIPKTLLIVSSRLYRSAPMGPQDQPNYVNAVAGLLTQLDASALLTHLKSIEKSRGKEAPAVRWGPRVIDFDLLVFGSARIATDELTVPHPGIAERNFVLAPLSDVAPDLDIAGVGKMSELVSRMHTTGLSVL